MNISGTVALVTGAASGIGRASAVGFARRGARAVVVADLDTEGSDLTAKAVRDAGSEATVVPTDVSDLTQLAALFAEAEQRFDGLDVVHNNAGLVTGLPPWPDTPIERIRLVVEVNTTAMFVGTRLAVEALSRRGGGAVVNTASGAAVNPLPDDPVYAGTKAAVAHFTRSCAPLRESHGVRVNAVLPGMVETPMAAKTGDGKPADWMIPLLDMFVLLTPDQIADAVAELVEDDTKAGETVEVMNQFR